MKGGSELKLSDFFTKGDILQDAEFAQTMFPGASVPGSACYVLRENALRRTLRNPNIAAIILPRVLENIGDVTVGLVLADDPRKAYYELHNEICERGLLPPLNPSEIDPTAIIAPTAILGKNVMIGRHSRVAHYAVLCDNTRIGNDVYVDERVVVGARGMQNIRVNGKLFRLCYAGGVRVGDGAEILAGAVIQRPYQVFYTEIGEGTQISVNVIVGHGAQIGRNSSVAGGSQIAGNVRIGDSVTVGPSVAISDGINIGDGCYVRLGSVVVQDLPAGQSVSGNFAISHIRHLRNHLELSNDRN